MPPTRWINNLAVFAFLPTPSGTKELVKLNEGLKRHLNMGEERVERWAFGMTAGILGLD